MSLLQLTFSLNDAGKCIQEGLIQNTGNFIRMLFLNKYAMDFQGEVITTWSFSMQARLHLTEIPIWNSREHVKSNTETREYRFVCNPLFLAGCVQVAF